ncbi:thioredoxin domain-containing protein [Pustulibacterium marinum]|nr:thioredoxin domain-containing protein [Pustulibacterium marinum]
MATPNKLIHEESPYLKQHAYNPVDWHPWSNETLELAKELQKPLLISIGYAACHWCHVMEKETFEDTDTAYYMNKNFINVKVDREEHPDVDRVYMNALKLMTNSGGWPLNIFAMPDGTPFHGCTYLPNETWKSNIQKLADIYYNEKEKIQLYTGQILNALRLFDLTEKVETSCIDIRLIRMANKEWSKKWDSEMGGTKGAPKFMMPSELNYLLNFAILEKNDEIKTHVFNTLTKIAQGGIFDVVAGGFSRYSVDEKWHVPHFEKMLYDNAQLLSLYSKAYRHSKNDYFKTIIDKTVHYLLKDFKNEQHLFYASYDADSLNNEKTQEEGAYYCWTKNELIELLGNEFPLFQEVFNINAAGYWEDDKYVLFRTKTWEELATSLHLEKNDLEKRIQICLTILESERSNRPKPALDHKIITSWNGLMISALVETYLALQYDQLLDLAILSANSVLKHLTSSENKLYHTLNYSKKIPGYLEDYAAIIDAFLKLYEVTGDFKWLNEAKFLVNICLDEFYEEETGMFYFTSKNQPAIISRGVERTDDVIPSSNSMMAQNLFKLASLTSSEIYRKYALTMTINIFSDARTHPQMYSNWLDLSLKTDSDTYEIVIIGKNAKDVYLQFTENYYPNHVYALSTSPSDSLIFKNRFQEGKTLIYVCKNNVCQLPHETVAEALNEINN